MKHLFVFTLVIVCFTSFMPIKSSATSWAYEFVVWDGYVYVLSDDYVKELNDVDQEIGHVTKYSDMKEYGGNFSNSYKEGTKYYSIKGISTDEVIAVQVNEDTYRIANRESKYQYKKGILDYTGWIVGGMAFISLVIYGFNKLEDLARRK